MPSQRSETTDQAPNNRAIMRRAFEAKRRPAIAERDDRPHGSPTDKRGDRRHLHAKLRELQSSDEDDWQDYEG